MSYNFLEFATVCMEEAVYFWGGNLMSRILGPIIDFLTNDFYMVFPTVNSPFLGQDR